jgi:hypothetical protein
MIFKFAVVILLCALTSATVFIARCSMVARRPVETYGLNKVGLMLRATWIDPFATELDPRRILVLGAEEIERMDPSSDVAKKMRECWEDPFSSSESPLDLIRLGADEIDRLESERRFTKREKDVR